MQNGHVTTPFGRRPMTLALVQRQLKTAEIASGKSVDKWKVFRDIAEARSILGLQDRSLAVLDALLTFHPSNTLKEGDQLVVFPSNLQLAHRAHGIAGATLRRHLACLVDAGLIIRRDSANGKRYVRKDRDGDIERAFGFDISPLLARAEEMAGAAQAVAADRIALRRLRENVTILRRDVRKILSAAIESGAPGDWADIECALVAILSGLSRTPSTNDLADCAAGLEALRTDILNALNNLDIVDIQSANAAHTEHHIHNSKPETILESEPAIEKTQGRNSTATRPQASSVKSFPLDLVLRACPEVVAYGPDGRIGNWREMMAAAVVVRSSLGVSPSAYQEACEVMGPENAAATIACILERAGAIRSAGAYLRDLTERSQRGEFSLGPMLMALLRANGQVGSRAG